MNNRILTIRKNCKLTQDAFAEKLNISKNFVWMLEKGERDPSDRTILDICKKFNINEEWLRTGQGEMYKTPEDETAIIVSDLLEENNPLYDIILGIAKTYQQLDSKSQDTILDFSQKLLDILKEEKKR